MKRKLALCMLALLMVPVLFTSSDAVVEWNIQQTLKMDLPPVDVVVSADGRRIFVLTESGEILVYTQNGRLSDRIGVGKHIDQIELGPTENLLLLRSRKKQTVDILEIDFVQKIDTIGSPFKGPMDAPVVIVVFGDFQ